MALGVGTYAPEMLTVIVDAHRVTGFADGSFVKITQQTEGITSVVGADGEVARAISADKRYEVSITLLQTSLSNDVFSAFLNVDRISGGLKPVALIIKDLRGRTVFEAGASWIKKFPDTEFGKDISSREWVFETASAEFFVGGAGIA